MRRLSDGKKLGLIAGVVTLLCGAGGGGVWWAKGKVEEKQLVIADLRTKIREAESKIEKIAAVEQDVIVLRENLLEYVKILPEAQEVNDFLRITQDFVAQSGVNMKQFLPGREASASKGSAFARYTYKFELTGTVWQFLQFASFFENWERFAQVTDFNIAAGVSRNGADAVHTISMTVETYVYSGKSTGKDVEIPNYENKVEKLQEEIYEARQTVVSDGFRYQGRRGRRDIFVDPRESSLAQSGDRTGPSPRDQQRILERVRAKVAECLKVHERLQDDTITIFERYALERELREKLGVVGEEVDEMQTKGYITHTPIKVAWGREVLEPLGRLRQHATAVGGPDADRWLPESEMKDLLAAMRSDLSAGDMGTAIDRCDTIRDKLSVPEDDPRHELRLAIEGVYLRAKLAREFSALKLDISGMCVTDVGRSGVILNGIVYQEGEYVDNNLLLKRVDNDRIEFVYKGFTVVRIL